MQPALAQVAYYDHSPGQYGYPRYWFEGIYLDSTPYSTCELAKESLHRRSVVLDLVLAWRRGGGRTRAMRHVRRHPQERKMECGSSRHSGCAVTES